MSIYDGKKVLITGIAGEIAQGIGRIIKENYPSWELHGSDIHTRHSGKLFVDKFLQLPKTDLKNKYINHKQNLINNPLLINEYTKYSNDIQKIQTDLQPRTTAARVDGDRITWRLQQRWHCRCSRLHHLSGQSGE